MENNDRLLRAFGSFEELMSEYKNMIGIPQESEAAVNELPVDSSCPQTAQEAPESSNTAPDFVASETDDGSAYPVPEETPEVPVALPYEEPLDEKVEVTYENLPAGVPEIESNENEGSAALHGRFVLNEAALRSISDEWQEIQEEPVLVELFSLREKYETDEGRLAPDETTEPDADDAGEPVVEAQADSSAEIIPAAADATAQPSEQDGENIAEAEDYTPDAGKGTEHTTETETGAQAEAADPCEETADVVVFEADDDAKRHKRKRKKQAYVGFVTVTAFTSFVAAASLANLIVPSSLYSDSEKRALSTFPKPSVVSILSGSFMDRFESYMSDKFIFRDQIVSVKSQFERLLGKNKQNGIYIGKDDRLFESQSEYSEEQVSSITNAIKEFCKSVGEKKTCSVLLAPNATSFYSRELPAFVETDDQKQQIEKVYSLLGDGISCVRVYDALEGLKDDYNLYYYSDHHWTTRAAKAAFDVLALSWKLDTTKVKYEFHTVSTEFSGTLADSSGVREKLDVIEACMPADSQGTYVVRHSDLQKKSTSLFETDKLNTDNQYEVFCGGNSSLISVSTTQRNGKSLLVFKDSYANCLLPMLTPYFQQITVVDARYFTDDINAVLKEDNYTHFLFLYNLNTFLEDNSLEDVLKKESGKQIDRLP